MKLLSSVMLHFGYAENAIVGPLLVSTRFFGNPGYLDHRQGLYDLAEDLWMTFVADTDSCLIDEFKDFLCSMPGQTSDRCLLGDGIDGKSYFVNRWFPHWVHDTYKDIIDGNFLLVGECAEELICALLHHKLPDKFEQNDKLIEHALKRVGTITTLGR